MGYSFTGKETPNQRSHSVKMESVLPNRQVGEPSFSEQFKVKGTDALTGVNQIPTKWLFFDWLKKACKSIFVRFEPFPTLRTTPLSENVYICWVSTLESSPGPHDLNI